MLIHQQRRAGECPIEHAEAFESLLSEVPDGFRRALAPARQRTAELLGISDFSLPIRQPRTVLRPNVLVNAEIVSTDESLFVIRLFVRFIRGAPLPAEGARFAVIQRYSLTIDYFGEERACVEFDVISNYLQEAFSISLDPEDAKSVQFDTLKEEGRVCPPMPTPADLAAAELLSQKEVRTLAIAIKQAGGLLVGDLSRQLRPESRERTEQIRDFLLNNEIITAETVVICKKTNAQVSRVPDQSVLVALAREGLRCACGNTITDEKVDTAVSISDRGQWLLDGSHWFTLLLINTLIECGVPLDQILVDQVAGGDEMDCIADLGGEIALFELKDKEFSLGNAYSFGAKIGIIEPRYSVIVTTEYVGNDAKEHFARSRRRSREGWMVSDESGSEQTVFYIEGMDNFKSGLMDLISRASLAHAEEALSDVMQRGALPLSIVLNSLRGRFLSVTGGASSLAPKPRVKPTTTPTVEGDAGV
jgi:hypothetical protein